MAYVSEKLQQLESALKKLEEVLNMPFSEITRDAAIQRFQFTYELLWKTIKVYLSEIEKIEASSPRACFREIKNPLKLSDEEIEMCLRMADDRNRSVHIYSEELAQKIYEQLRNYCTLSKKIYTQLSPWK